MCLILAAYKTHPRYDLVILANRDEFYSRPTAGAHWWDNPGGIFAGKDMKAGGTWLGVNRSGDFSALTNYRDPSSFRPEARSRGGLVSGFLHDIRNMEEYNADYLSDTSDYNDFNLLLYRGGRLFYYSSVKNDLIALQPGIFGLSNHLLDSSWPKVDKGKQKLEGLLNGPKIDPNDAFGILDDRLTAPDDLLPDTGVGIDKERLLSPMHIDFPGYGTRSSNVLLFSNQGAIEFYEKDHLKGSSVNEIITV